ncbi:GNAT family N-acetyltransferase [Thalassiella azotivora]
MHPLGKLLTDAADGVFPAQDGGWHRVAPWRPGTEAVVAFTGHAVLAVADDVTDDVLHGWDVDGYGGALHPRVLQGLVGAHGWVDGLDVVVVARGRAGLPGHRPGVDAPPLVACDDLADHPRVRHAEALRDDVRVWADVDRSGLITLGRGLGGLPELSVEVVHAGRGLGRRLMAAALDLVPPEQVVVASVAPGNAASLRALLASGFAPVGAVQVYRPERGG